MVLAVCSSVLGNSADAEDASQAVFLTLAQKPTLRHACLAGWLHRVAWFVAARAAAARAIRRRHEQEAATMPRPNPPDPLSGELVHAALAKLPEKYRVPLLLHHIEGRSQEETAALLGISTSAVAMRLNRGRQMLRDRIAGAPQVPASALISALIPAFVPHNFISTASYSAKLAATHKLAATTIVSGPTLALSKGAINMLFWTKVKFVASLILAIVLTGGAVGTYVAVAQTQPVQIAGGGNITALTDTSITITRGDKATTVTIDASTVIKLDGAVKTAADLKTGLYAMAFGSGTNATEVRAYTPKPPASQPASQPNQIAGGGLITGLTATSVTITRSDKATTVTIDASTVIKIDGVVKTAADLKTGLYAMAFGSGINATEIRAYTPKPPTTQTSTSSTNPGPFLISGSITAADATSLTVKGSVNSLTIAIDSKTVVKVDGKVATTADLLVGQNVGVFGTTGKPAVEIRAYTPKPK